MKTNQTTNSFTIFGTPTRVFVNGLKFKDKYVIAALLASLAKTPHVVKAFAIFRINGVVRLYIKTTEAAQ